MSDSRPTVVMGGIDKRYGAIEALREVDYRAYGHSINAVIGENGAGKTTLMKVLFGLIKPNAGTMTINGRTPPSPFRPRQAISLGLGMLQQHFSLVPVFTVLENIILGSEPKAGVRIDEHEARTRVRSILDDLGADTDLDSPISELSVSARQQVEIARMLYTGADILIFDEPTATLAPQEIERLYKLLQRLASDGATIILITHRLAEVLSYVQHVTVLRRGQVTATFAHGEMDEDSLISAMVPEAEKGKTHPLPAIRAEAAPIISLADLCCRDDRSHDVLRNVSLDARPGEIVGVAGVSGSGQLELAETIIGLRPPVSGQILFDGKRITALTTAKRRKLGFVYIPEDRLHDAIIPPFSLTLNRLLGDHRRPQFRAHGTYKMKMLRQDVREKIRRYAVDAGDVELSIASLSGGNQQKMVLARELDRKPSVVIAHGPTRGLDVLASLLFYERLMLLSENGAAVVLFSAELEDLLRYTHSISVLFAGSLIDAGPSNDLDTKKIGLLMTRGRAA